VTADGPAATAGLKAGDIVTRINGTLVRDSRMMQRLVVEAPIGRALGLTLLRGGRAVGANVLVARRKDAPAPVR
jgi:serine protease Do